MISSIGSNGIFLRSLVVDGDPISRRALIDLLSTNPATRVVKTCSNGPDAIVAIREWKPDVLLCEVETPGIDCFAVLETISAKERPAVIFISRTDRYAARAFDVAAADYLVKPIRQERLWKALERAKHQIESRTIPGASPTTERSGRQLVIRSGRSATFIKSNEVDWAEAEGKYVRLHMGKDFIILKIGISALEAKLDPNQFVRIHRSTLINVDRVRLVQPWNNRRTYQVTLQDGTQLVLSRKSKLLEMSSKTIASTTEGSYRNDLNTGIV